MDAPKIEERHRADAVSLLKPVTLTESLHHWVRTGEDPPSELDMGLVMGCLKTWAAKFAAWEERGARRSGNAFTIRGLEDKLSNVKERRDRAEEALVNLIAVIMPRQDELFALERRRYKNSTCYLLMCADYFERMHKVALELRERAGSDLAVGGRP